MKNTTKLTQNGVDNLPIDPTFEDCKVFAINKGHSLRKAIEDIYKEQGLDLNITFTDPAVQPQLIDDPNPYRVILNILEQYGNMALTSYKIGSVAIAMGKEVKDWMLEIKREKELQNETRELLARAQALVR